MGLIIIRIIALRQIRLMLVALGLGGLMVMICIYNLHSLDQQRLPVSKNQTMLIKVQADALKIKPGYFYGQATLLATDDKVLVSGPIKTDAELAQWSNMDQTKLIQVTGDVQLIEPATNRNQFNPKRYYETQNITNSVKIKQLHHIMNSNHWSITDAIHTFRKRMINYANQLPHPLNLYVLSLIIGEASADVYDEVIGVKQLGLIHLFSISGLHVYYFIMVVELLLIWMRVKREHYQILIMLVLPLYFIFSGSSVGLLRAILMVEASLLINYFNLRIKSLDIWAIALIINLMIAPRSLISLGTQLSYLLSLGLIFTSHFSFFKQTILMNMISIPLVIYHIYEWHLLTFIANLFILPLFTIIVFPIVIIGMLVYPILPMLSMWIAIVLHYFDVIVNWIGALPGNIVFGKPSIWFTLILIWLTLLLIGRATVKRTLLLFSCYVVAFISVHYPLQGEITYFDVGQGDSFLVREPFNRSVNLIDTGGKVVFGKQNVSEPTSYNAEKTSINYLKSIGISRIDNLFITHQDADHSGDLPAFLTKMRVDNLVIPIGMQNNDSFMAKISGKMDNTQLIQARFGMSFEKSLMNIYHPFTDGLGANEDSMVISTQVANRRFLFMGDLDQHGELEIIKALPQLTTNVLKVGHHGSKTSTSPSFLKQVNPQVAIISAGRNNRYGHPNQEVMNQLHAMNIKIYNTQVDGMITYRYGGIKNASFETQLKEGSQ
ncbi:DNA internalization-related competence protein ComEC/Rec2 [Nicoliella sp. Es01]|uniref:DNA internalization-related competence protein ComEC/Rec2 n=1 Tax=Nicoliella lavandulae TaxID=3082954 RepID=A0ABU8SLH8_9LACO